MLARRVRFLTSVNALRLLKGNLNTGTMRELVLLIWELVVFVDSFSTTSCFKEKWDLLTAVCLERKPVITPTPNEIETKFAKYLQEVEFERSLKSDHEVRHELEV